MQIILLSGILTVAVCLYIKYGSSKEDIEENKLDHDGFSDAIFFDCEPIDRIYQN